MKDKDKEKKPDRDNKYDTSKKTRRTLIGGQALLEGVMMRGKTSLAMAVRSPDGELELQSERLKKPSKARKIPFLRGVLVFVDSLVVGMRTLLKSAEVSSPEDEAPSKLSSTIAVILGVVLAVGLFIAIPWFVGWSIKKWTAFDNAALISLIEGITRLVLFVAYLALIRLLPDIKRTFMYHGAEHRTINCYERGLPLTVENVQSCSTKHNRCGTTFLFFVVIFAILLYALLNWLFKLFVGYEYLFENFFFTLMIRLLLLPVIAGLSYELLRLLAGLPDNKFTNAIRAPGLALQKLSTCIPDDGMAECAIAAFEEVLRLDADETAQTIDFYERDFKTERQKLKELTEPDPQDADWIYCELLGKKRAELDCVSRIKIGYVKSAREYAERLKNGEPLDYILGNSEFCGIKLKVDSRVLIPRFETEELAKKAGELIGGRDVRVLDLCTGSGCIAAYVARNTRADIVASDLSDAALEVATENLKGLGVTVVKSDMFEAIDGKFDIIVSNPPYVKTFEIDALQPQVTCQPRMALDGGEDGLRFYRIIADNAAARLEKNGIVLLEIGADQADDVKKLFDGIGECEILKDLEGRDRILICRT